MDLLEHLLVSIQYLAKANGMQVYIVGARSSDADGKDGRLLKICPTGILSRVLIEIEADWSMIRLYRHRTKELTRKYKGRPLSTKWLQQFIKENRPLALQLIEENTFGHANIDDIDEEHNRPLLKSQIADQNVKEHLPLRQQRIVHLCSCRGEVEKCIRCFGSGSYATDEFGNPV